MKMLVHEECSWTFVGLELETTQWAKDNPFERKQETALMDPECTAPKGATSITTTRPKKRTLGEVIAGDGFVCVCVCVCGDVCVCVLEFV